jgi:hypothetical protein
VLDVGKSHSDHALAQAILLPAPAFDLFGFFCGQLERAADDKFPLEQFEAREAWIAQATEHLTAIYRLAEEFAPKHLAELVAYLSWRDVYLVRHEDGVYTLHPTIQ